MKPKAAIIILLTISLLGVSVLNSSGIDAQRRRTLYWGTSGSDVWLLQRRLTQWGYYRGPADGIFGSRTSSAVRLFQSRNGLRVDGIVGPTTWSALGLGGGTPRPAAAARASGGVKGVSNNNNIHMLARIIHAEARAEPYIGQVAVGAVILNRIESSKFPNTMAGVIYQPLAFESVANGQFNLPPTEENYRAARDALNGWDPTYGSTFFWNPAKPVSRWIWSRRIVVRLGKHVFGR